MGWEGMNWIYLAHVLDRGWGLLNGVMNVLLPSSVGNFLTS